MSKILPSALLVLIGTLMIASGIVTKANLPNQTDSWMNPVVVFFFLAGIYNLAYAYRNAKVETKEKTEREMRKKLGGRCVWLEEKRIPTSMAVGETYEILAKGSAGDAGPNFTFTWYILKQISDGTEFFVKTSSSLSLPDRFVLWHETIKMSEDGEEASKYIFRTRPLPVEYAVMAN